MTSTKSPKFIQAATEMLAEELARFGSLSSTDSMKLSETLIPKIDWDNEALMHKGFSWIAKNYFYKKTALN